MSLVTRCPACSTMFKVVPDQIRIAAGWVRCGNCGEVFDASSHMLPYERTARVARPAPTPPQPPQAEDVVSTAHLLHQRSVAPMSDPEPSPAVVEERVDSVALTAATPAGASPAPIFFGEPAEFATTELHDAAAHSAWAEQAPPIEEPRHDTPPPALEHAQAESALAAPMAPSGADESTATPIQTVGEWASMHTPGPEPKLATGMREGHGIVDDAASEPWVWPPDTEAAGTPAPAGAALTVPEAGPGLTKTQPAPSFVAEAQRRAFWASRPVRLGLWLLAVLLLLGLIGQAALSRRDWLAAREPGLAPMLNTLCAPLGCRVQPYRQLNAIVIDSSAFNRSGANSFRFSITLRNASDLPVASPALELTLTDAQDQPLVRRVVAAADLGAPPSLAAHGEFSGVSVLTVGDAANPGAVVGYRLVAFYP